MKYRVTIAFLVLLGMVPIAGAKERTPAPDCPWRVVAVREPHRGEKPFEEATHYLRPTEWEDRNNVPGPDGLWARVRTKNPRHGYLEIENVQTGEDSLLILPYGCLPSWSADGRYISCDVWTPTTTAGKLNVFEIATKQVVVDMAIASATNTKWSPDSQMIAGSGVSYGDQHCILYTVGVPGGHVTVIDTLDVFADQDFSWSPDSRWIVYDRPTRVHHVGDTMASDLWIADATTGVNWCLIQAPDHVESNPLWITDHTVQVARVWWDEDGSSNRSQRMVVVLGRVE